MSPEEERVIIDAAEALAGSDAGVPAKTRAVVLRRETKWLVSCSWTSTEELHACVQGRVCQN